MHNRPPSDVGPFVLLGFIGEWLTAGQPRASSWTFPSNYGGNKIPTCSFCWTLDLNVDYMKSCFTK